MENYTEPNNGEKKGAHLLAHGFGGKLTPPLSQAYVNEG